MIIHKKLYTVADFESLAVGDLLAVEFNDSFHNGTLEKSLMLNAFHIEEIDLKTKEIVLRAKDSIHFNYVSFTKGDSICNSIELLYIQNNFSTKEIFDYMDNLNPKQKDILYYILGLDSSFTKTTKEQDIWRNSFFADKKDNIYTNILNKFCEDNICIKTDDVINSNLYIYHIRDNIEDAIYSYWSKDKREA